MIHRPRVGQHVVVAVDLRRPQYREAVVTNTWKSGTEVTLVFPGGARLRLYRENIFTMQEGLRLALQEAAGQEPTP